MLKKIKIKMPKDAWWLDNSLYMAYQRCPREYYWRAIQHITPAQQGLAAINGTAYHEAKAVYLTKRMEGATHDEAKTGAIEAMMPILAEIKEDHDLYNISRASTIMENYFDFWKDSRYNPIQVEVGFAIDLDELVFIGRIDSYEDCPPFGKVVVETKSTTIVGERWHLRGEPNSQIDAYVTAIWLLTGEKPFGGVLDVIPVTKDRIKQPFRIISSRDEKAVESWVSDVKAVASRIKRDQETRTFPRNTDRCVPLLGFMCSYRTLCKRYPSITDLSEIELGDDYKIEPWQPFDLENEGEED